MENSQETPEKPRLNVGSRGAALVGTFFVSGPLLFALWIYLAKIDINASPPAHIWAVPIAAAVCCTMMVQLLPDPIVRIIGKLFGWIPYV